MESQIAIPKEYLTEDEVAEMEAVDEPEEVEEEVVEAGEGVAEVNVADKSWETAEATHEEPQGGSYAHEEPGSGPDAGEGTMHNASVRRPIPPAQKRAMKRPRVSLVPNPRFQIPSVSAFWSVGSGI